MESNNYFELVGGVTRAVIYPASTSLPELGEESDLGYELTIDLGSSSYTERLSLESGSRQVLHTFSFETLPRESPFDEKLTNRALREGIVADLTLSSGTIIRVGWSARYGVEFPLRLESADFSSGEAAADYPMQKWVWSSTDRNTLV